MEDSTPRPSPQLLAANQQLYALRAQVQAGCLVQATTSSATAKESCAESLPWPTDLPETHDSVADKIANLPAHLGWGSQALTAVQRRQFQKPDRAAGQKWLKFSQSTSASPERPKAEASIPTWVKLYPDIGLGMLRRELAAPGRLWLMLRYLDREGCGLLRIDNLVNLLARKSSSHRLCGKRQLRNLLRDGEDVYWTRDKERVWLRSAARVAHALGVERLTGRPVALPVSALLDGIGSFRAHLYAAFHSGRIKDTPHGEQTMPIARETMEQLSGVGRSSQRAYEERVGIDVQANFAVGEKSTKEDLEKRAWAKGRALFELKDYRGQQGKKGKTYLAWQLPNTYIGQHRHRPRGRQKRINRKLKDLVMKGMPGNAEGTNETQKPAPSRAERPDKIYFPNGKLAAKSYSRSPQRELYWKGHRTGNGRYDLWQRLGRG